MLSPESRLPRVLETLFPGKPAKIVGADHRGIHIEIGTIAPTRVRVFPGGRPATSTAEGLGGGGGDDQPSSTPPESTPSDQA